MAYDKRENSKSELSKQEEQTLDFWKKQNIFKRSLEKKAPRGDFIFYEGPPTANGRPGIHHLEARAFKDIILRFRTMEGYFVRRKGGWDTHGLPVELQVEKELGLSSKKEIEEYGIAKFNKKCRESVWTYVDEWTRFTDRIGFWVDQENPYITYKNSYIESVWHILKTVFEKGHVYKDYKVVPWCPRCGTALSSHELAQGYQDVKDLSVTVKFKVKDEDNTYLLAWTTTPWTLPGNVALAVGKDIEYVKVRVGEEFYILAKERVSVLPEEGEIIETKKGSELVGMSYEPLYDFIASKKDIENNKNAWKVYEASFVTTEDGTGIVHTAVMYGQDDFELGTKVGLPKYHLVSEDGTFTDETGFLKGAFVKDENTAVAIIKDLAGRSILLKKEKYEHSYPHCWRCKTPLIYYARDSWYIRMSTFRDKLVKENKDINWEPAHIKEGRFGEWLRDIKDWAISRERYWGTPLPLWKDTKTNEYVVIGSIEELKKYTKSSGNTYRIMRHGTADSNHKSIVSADNSVPSHITEEGKEETKRAAGKLRSAHIDRIYVSPLDRTQETAEIVREELGLPKEKVVVDERLKEIQTGEFNGKNVNEYRAFFSSLEEKMTKRPQGGENLLDMKRRIGDFMYEIEQKHEKENILIVAHEYTAWMLTAVAEGASQERTVVLRGKKDDFIANAEVQQISFTPLPHNEEYELDLHRPYIDDIVLEKDEVKLERVSEVMDVWFDSGAMPYAEEHYPFENTDTFQPHGGLLKKQKGYPADYITEAIDQTRGWFYTLHAIGVLLGYGKAYRNVICLGHILDEQGKKMSKSLGNILDPWDLIEKYGVDALRFWMYSVNQPGESKNFDERTVDEVVKKVFNLLVNTVRFFAMYKNETVASGTESTHLLDRWILSKLSLLIENVTKDLEQFEVLRPAREIRDFIADLSQWYVRRSRDRFKNENERNDALATLRYVLITLAKVMAPFTPFIAEKVYQETKAADDPESVHLADWPTPLRKDDAVLTTMQLTRQIVSDGLQGRAEAGLKVRQPLASVTIQKNIPEEYRALIKDELNVKEIIIDEKRETLTKLDTMVTDVLEEEGNYRELVRHIQDMRKTEGLNQSDMATLIIATDDNGKQFIQKWKDDLKRTTSLAAIEFKDTLDVSEVTIGGSEYRLTLSK